MILKKIVFLFTISIVLFSCKTADTKSRDFTEENRFTAGIEGPAVDSKGNLYAVNFKEEGTIGIVNNKGEASLYTILPKGSIGNGIRFDKEDNMYIADYTKHTILFIKNGTKEAVVFAHNNTLNQPNDIAISSKGILYASDPNWKEETGNLWMIKNKKFVLLEKNMGTTNGIEVSTNGKKLYVNESVQRTVWVYDILEDGTLNNKKIFIKFKDFGLDGMRCDDDGNLFITRYGKGSVVVVSPKGIVIREITLIGKKPSNITFSNNKKQCFVTLADRGCIETFYN